MIKIIVIVLSFYGLLHTCVAVFNQIGQCSDLGEANNFSLTEFLGQWMVARRSENEGEGADCSSINITENEDDENIAFYHRALDKNFLVEYSGNVSVVNSIITLNFNEEIAPLEVTVLDVFYDLYAITYTCQDVSQFSRNVGIYVIRRPEILIGGAMETAINHTLFINLGVYFNDLRQLDFSEDACYRLPEIDSGPIILPGLCNNLSAVESFNPSEFIGQWHEIASYYSDNALGTCARAEYTLGPGGIFVENSHVVNQTLITLSGNATIISEDESGILRVMLEVTPGVFATQDLWVLATDYFNFAVTYSCIDLPATEEKRVYSWILGRNQYLSGIAQAEVDSVVNSHMELNMRYYQDTLRDDEDCFFYPEANGLPVVFRGLCDQNISVMDSFVPSDYLGLWHSIESYPSQFIDGACVNAVYSIGSEGLNVINSQVIDERLITISGTAVPSETEPGKLVVTFPIEGTNLTIESDYWVLYTDYVSYSLVYSCADIPESRERSVVSWKLSRTKSLTTNATETIDQIMSTIPVLDQKYFVLDDQSEPNCFYYPDPVPGQPVVFPGQCENITTQPYFNLTLFEGIWYEVEAYPTGQGGQCVSREFATDGELSLTLSQVVDQFLVTNSSIVTSDPTDNAKLILTDVNGSQIPFWILKTDYEMYTLAYSCIQIDEDFRLIQSWKLSRNITLDDDSNAAINEAIETVPVLNNTYFEPIDHSFDACFILPDLEPGEPIILVGQCDQNISVVQSFRPDLYQGTWRLISSYPTEFQNGTCQDATYTLTSETIVVYNTQVVNEELATITGTAVLATADQSGKLLVSFPGTPDEAEYWILETDYFSYSLVYSCRDISPTERRVWSWKLSRTDSLTEYAEDVINAKIDEVQVLHNRYYELVDRRAEACFYYPIPNGEPVVFRGQCDENLPVMQYFDATSYTGLWHNIESFPSLTQPGECNNAYYSLEDDVVIVYNTEVINQALSSIYGVAYPSPDEPAKLIVNFPSVGNQTTDYWILDTDYSSYSLVYTCVNDGPYYRRVWSWKLSRTKELTPEAVSAIYNVTSNIQILDQRYYEEGDQSPEACFYFPDPVLGQAVVFPGQCNQTLSVMDNFNISLFEGRWHEIQSYPAGQPQGECINHIISSNGVDNDLVSNRVFDLSLERSLSTLSGNDARMTINMTTPTGVVLLPFWILQTDYENYALAYSCIDNNDDTRNVYSWKLSKHRTLSEDSLNAIDTAMEPVDVLQNIYYEHVNHSDVACFYLPDLEPGDPVIFPGQCDENIDVVANFNPVNYTGRWRLISSYPSEFQVGTCNDAYYQTLEDGTIEVYNTEVVNQNLNTTKGTAEIIGNGKLLVYFPTVLEPIEYWILDTDYVEYSLIYRCVNINLEQRQVWSWMMSRSNSLGNSSMDAIGLIVDGIEVLSDQYFADIGRTEDDCFYFPEPTGNPVLFRGQCNPNIPVEQNFQLELYNGTWYAIESYPTEFQLGNCPIGHYTFDPDSGALEVFYTQVYNQRLNTINATAVTNNNDTGILNITFPFPDGYEVETQYWVIDTDYSNYSLVYSCDNFNEEYMRVSAWKLSRQPFLYPESNAAIDAAMLNIRVINQKYFTQWDHGEDDCLYYPELTDGQVILSGQCEDNPIVEIDNFIPADFAGIWYEFARFPSNYQSGECAINNWELTNPNTFTLSKTIVDNERLVTMSEPFTISADGNGVLFANMTYENGTSVNLDLYILATDHDNFALLYSCLNFDENRKQVFSWQLTKNRGTLTQLAIETIQEKVSETRDLFYDYYQYSDHSVDACFYYPYFDPLPDRIELPGPCDERIQGMANFSLNAYSGHWFETSSYPTTYQEGTCPRVSYSSRSPTIFEKAYSEVMNSTLISDHGLSMVDSDDGSGVIAAHFNGAQVDFTVYVLATDYTSYSLVYTCDNLPNGDRLVASWKMSRTKTLSAEANNAMNAKILETQGLIEDYYVPSSQTEEDCFYIPSVNETAAPLFRGTCKDVPTMTDFDIQNFLGEWNEIESYPRDTNRGECFNTNYWSSGNTINAVDTGIFGVTAEIFTGTVQANANGRLVRVMSNGDQTIEEEILVLNTDYNNYALLYSCEDVNIEDEDFRRIWSAKYGRSRSSESLVHGQEEMDEIIASIEVLEPQFYLPADHSDDACFHYPEQTGEQIVLPGQCDDNIPVVPNFNVAEYSGEWFLTERYLQPYETGNCTGAEYTVDDDTGVVTVLNWEVVDGELETIEGSAVLIESADGGARLRVSLPIGDTEEMTESTLYILSTDYVSYSLAYSCVNLNEAQRVVAAWKLSRDRVMSAAGNNAINQLIDDRDELHQPFFISIEQDEECPVPSSSIIFRSSIIILLLCLAFKKLF